MPGWVVYQNGQKVDLISGKTPLVVRDGLIHVTFLEITAQRMIKVSVNDPVQGNRWEVAPEKFHPKLTVDWVD